MQGVSSLSPKPKYPLFPHLLFILWHHYLVGWFVHYLIIVLTQITGYMSANITLNAFVPLYYIEAYNYFYLQNYTPQFNISELLQTVSDEDIHVSPVVA